jgi:hypothetical protein
MSVQLELIGLFCREWKREKVWRNDRMFFIFSAYPKAAYTHSHNSQGINLKTTNISIHILCPFPLLTLIHHIPYLHKCANI